MAQSAGEPLHLGALGSGSDYTVFIDHLGVPSLGPGYGSPNGIYHSLYDTLNWFLKFGDPGYKYGVAQADMVGRIMMRLASAEVLPFDSTGTADAVGRHLEELSALDSEGEMREVLATVASANGRMRTAAVEANLAIETLLARGARYLDGKNEELDELNGLIMKVERDYLDERGPAAPALVSEPPVRSRLLHRLRSENPAGSTRGDGGGRVGARAATSGTASRSSPPGGADSGRGGRASAKG